MDTDSDRVAVETFKDTDQMELEMFDVANWEEAIRAKGIVITPLIERLGTAVIIAEKDVDTQEVRRQIACLVPPEDNDGRLLDETELAYHALISSDMRTARVFFSEILTECLVPIGEILYLDMQVLDDPQFRAQGAGGKVLFTRLDVPHIRLPEVGKLYVTCLYQPKGGRGRVAKSASPITLAVNPWNVQLASDYQGSQASVVKHLY